MASTPVTLLSKRSGNSADRPLVTTVQAGELAINFAAAENGLYFKDSSGDIRKVTGVHYGASAPNSSPAGETGALQISPGAKSGLTPVLIISFEFGTEAVLLRLEQLLLTPQAPLQSLLHRVRLLLIVP